jgi:hypothetical protein
MAIMELIEAEIGNDEIEEVELKYCERCGGLWLRLKGNVEIYCAPCIPKIDELPGGRHPRRMEARWPVGRGLKLENAIDAIVELCIRGGRA